MLFLLLPSKLKFSDIDFGKLVSGELKTEKKYKQRRNSARPPHRTFFYLQMKATFVCQFTRLSPLLSSE